MQRRHALPQPLLLTLRALEPHRRGLLLILQVRLQLRAVRDRHEEGTHTAEKRRARSDLPDLLDRSLQLAHLQLQLLALRDDDLRLLLQLLELRELVLDLRGELPGHGAAKMSEVEEALGRSRAVDLLEALFLGLLQGLTEFLPISSTAHLTLAGRALGLIDDTAPERWTAFLAVVQLGTLAAVASYFRADLAKMARGDPDARRLAGLILLGTIPIGLVGFALRDVIEGPLTKDLRLIAATLILLGLLLGLSDRLGRRERPIHAITWRDALAIGTAQTLSLIPGSSRSGTTLMGGLLAGLTREAAARYSFLLSIPAIAASGLFELPTALRAPADDITALLVATIAAALSGYLAIAFMLRYLRSRSTALFVAYRVLLGAGVLGAVGAGWL